MKANYLRIGNWIMGIGYMRVTELKTELGNNFITASNKDVVFMDEEDSFCPIELTEEVLLKIGFGKRNDCYTLSNEYIFFVYYKDSFKQELLASVKRKGKCYYNTNELKNYDIKYLHQLQNAYYLLTGQELNIEL